MKTPNYTILTVLFLMYLNNTRAQQLPQYSQYMANGFLLNPALAGIDELTDLKTGYRKQWTALTDAPTTFYLTAHQPIATNARPNRRKQTPRFAQTILTNDDYNLANHFGVGTTIINDQTGPTGMLALGATVSYHATMANDLKISIGTTLGATQYSLNFDQIRLANPQDPAVPQGKINLWKPDLQVGVLVHKSQFYVSLSAHQLLGGSLAYADKTPVLNKLSRHYFLAGGYRFPVSDRLVLMPSVLIKWSSPVPMSVDLNLRANYDGRFWGGVSYRHRAAVAIMCGLVFNKFLNFSYAYDLPTSATFGGAAGGTHEVVLGLTINNRSSVKYPHFW